MTPSDYAKFRHDAVHDLMRLNDSCERDFRISQWPQWHYDLDRGTLSFLQDGLPRVVASIQVVGTTSEKEGTWLWSWANESIPASVTGVIRTVREFGEKEGVSQLTASSSPLEEHVGWEMTAIAAKVLGAKGGYRCPDEKRFMYVIYTDISFAIPSTNPSATRRIVCGSHGTGYETFVCEHLLSNPKQPWISDEASEQNRWPDAWCADCEKLFQEQGEWNSQNEPKTSIRLICHYCYESLRSRSPAPK